MDETAVTIGTASEIESTIDYEVAPPAAPYEVESGASTGGSIQQTFEQLLRFLSDPSNYRNLFESIQTSAQEFLGEERYATVAENALPVICIFVWTIIIYLIAYIKGRDSKESHLEGEMMKTQAEIFKIEKDLTRYDTQLKKGKINGSKWNTRILLFMIVGEILMVLYIYFIHRKYFYHPVKETFSLHNLPPELACVVFFIIMMVWKRLVSCFYSRSISRAQKNIKKDFERYAPLKTKYDKLMEENNHSQVMKTMANIDRIKNSYTKKPQPQRVTQHKPVPKPDASKMQHIPAPTTPQQFQTPQLRNRAQPQGQYTAPLPVYTKQAPPISPYIPPDIKNSGSSGIWGTAIGLISGNSSDVEDAICEFCGENNGPWPKDEIKQFECRKCKKFNGAKRSHSKPEKKEPPPEVPEEDEEEVNKKED